MCTRQLVHQLICIEKILISNLELHPIVDNSVVCGCMTQRNMWSVAATYTTFVCTQ